MTDQETCGALPKNAKGDLSYEAKSLECGCTLPKGHAALHQAPRVDGGTTSWACDVLANGFFTRPREVKP